MTLFEKILRSTPSDNKFFDVQDSIKKSTVFKIDNVADLFWQSKQIYWDIGKDFPNIAPPFDNFWMEYNLSDTINTEDGLYENHPLKYTSMGILFSSAPDTLGIGGWRMAAIPFIEVGAGVLGGSFIVQFGILEDGSLANYNGKPLIIELYDKKVFDSEEQVRKQISLVHPGLLAISFMHCRNVEMIEHGDIKHIVRRKPKPKIRYYTLQIEPMKKVLKDKGQSEKTGLKQALHICRGHFKDYREKGLFGKYKDIYWWDSQVRGNAKEGVVAKDYKPPVQEKRAR